MCVCACVCVCVCFTEAVMLFNFRSPEYISDEYDSPTELSVLVYTLCVLSH